MTTTAVPSPSYADILDNKKILYMPSCLVVEMMTKLYSQVSKISVTGSLSHIVPDLHLMLNRMTYNLQTTARAYRESRIKFFIGDWKDDKLRARKLFFNTMSRLGYVCELTDAVEKEVLYGAVEDMSAAWGELNRTMEEKSARPRSANGVHTCLYFRSQHPASWRQRMAQAILSLNDRGDTAEPDSHLILLCYKRIRSVMLKAIEEIERKTSVTRKFSPEKILCVSHEDIPISCPTCTTMTDSLRQGTCEIASDDFPSPGSDTVVIRKSTAVRKDTVVRGATRRIATRVELGGRYPAAPLLGGRVVR